MHKSGKPFSQLSWSKTTMKRFFLILAFCTLSWSRSVKRSHHSSKHSHRSRDGGGSRETFHDFMKQHPYLAANVHSVHQDFLGMIIFSLFNSRRMTNWTFHKTTKNGVLVRKWPLSPPSLSYWGRTWPWLFTCLILENQLTLFLNLWAMFDINSISRKIDFYMYQFSNCVNTFSNYQFSRFETRTTRWLPLESFKL